jgi:uncharacterized protein with PIN domain
MEIGAILILFSMLLLVGMALGKPFFDLESQPENPPMDLKFYAKAQEAIPVLLIQQESILEQLSELETEAQQGKISKDGYTYARHALINQGTLILQKLEQLEAASVPEVEDTQYGNYDQHDARIEEMITEHRKKNHEKMIGFCPKCGKPAQKSDQFCSRCGYKMER